MTNPATNIPYNAIEHCKDDLDCAIITVNQMKPECREFAQFASPDLEAMWRNGDLEVYEMWLAWWPLGIYGGAWMKDYDEDGTIDKARVFYLPSADNSVLYHELIHIKGPCKDRYHPF